MTLHGPAAAFADAVAAAARARGRGALPPGPAEAVYANDVHYSYRPDTNVRYLSGFEEPCALILSNHGKEEDGFTLCVRARDDRVRDVDRDARRHRGRARHLRRRPRFPIEERSRCCCASCAAPTASTTRTAATRS